MPQASELLAPMLLAIDAGNSFIKWAYHDGQNWRSPGRVARNAWCHDPHQYLSLPPQRIILANVAGPTVLAALQRAFPEPVVEVVQAKTRACKVINLYQPAESLGADRWAGLIAARALVSGACLVVSFGTALTVDALSADGEFLGGVIMPGGQLLRETLSKSTHALPLSSGTVQTYPRTTADAIESGIAYAISGAIEAVAQNLARDHGPVVHCLVTGGGAESFAEQLNRPYQVVDNLVLQGLLLLAHDKESN